MGAISFNGSIYPAGSTQASDSVYDNTHTGLPANVQGALDKTTGNITALNTVELTATAAHAHAVGTYFIWIGQFVKVTSAIAVGDTIADGTNVEATSIADVLTAANGAIEGKLSPSDVINNLTSTAANLPLSAAMGKSLSEAKQDKLTNPLTQSDVVNNLTSTATNLPLSAAMGKSLKDSVDIKSGYINSIGTLNASLFSIMTGVGYYIIGEIASGCDIYKKLSDTYHNSGDFTLHVLHYNPAGYAYSILTSPRLQMPIYVQTWAGVSYVFLDPMISGFDSTIDNNNATSGIYWINGYASVANKAFNFHYILICVQSSTGIIFQVAIPIVGGATSGIFTKSRSYQNGSWTPWIQ